MPQAQGTRTRHTRQAVAVVTAMSGLPAFSDARQIHAAAQRGGEAIGLATVYRHLRVLAEDGRLDVVRGPAGESRYRLRQGHVTHQLTCRACGRVVEVDGTEAWEWAQQTATEAGFTLTGHVVELVGLCPEHQPGGAPGIP
jgi:Fur family transcriptional regulator, ferric uptake regulator